MIPPREMQMKEITTGILDVFEEVKHVAFSISKLPDLTEIDLDL